MGTKGGQPKMLMSLIFSQRLSQRLSQRYGHKQKAAQKATAVLVSTGLATAALSAGFIVPFSTAQSGGQNLATQLTPILADAAVLKKIGARILALHPETQVGFAEVTKEQEQELSILAHEAGRCGGYEVLGSSDLTFLDPGAVFGALSEREETNRRFQTERHLFRAPRARPEIQAAINEVSEENLRQTVEMMSAFETRFHRGTQPNQSVLALKAHVERVLTGATIPYQIDLISHSSTPQQSLRVRLTGASRPAEVVVLGGHLDSINQEWFGSSKHAPGADDNASGSANLVEAARILARQAQPERTIEIMWYAGEEGGLLGSAEIARSYKSGGVDVIAVLQLDMTLFPGDGEFTLGSMTDFTSAWLREHLVRLNALYLNGRIIEDQCGYGCSDHASWHRQGFPAIMPFEATFDRMNQNLHTTRDLIDTRSSFRHAAMFSRLAVALAMDLGNSTAREHD